MRQRERASDVSWKRDSDRVPDPVSLADLGVLLDAPDDVLRLLGQIARVRPRLAGVEVRLLQRQITVALIRGGTSRKWRITVELYLPHISRSRADRVAEQIGVELLEDVCGCEMQPVKVFSVNHLQW